MRCPSCGIRMCQSELTSVVFLIHEPADTHEVLTALRCPLFGASQSLTIPATLRSPQKGSRFIPTENIIHSEDWNLPSKEKVLIQVQMRRWARTW